MAIVMEEETREKEISTEEAIEALTDYDIGLDRSESSHVLPEIRFEGRDVSEGFLWDSTSDYSRRDVDRVIQRMYDFASHWAEEKGYDLEIENQTFFHQPIDEELISSVRGSIQMDEDEIDFSWYGMDGRLRFNYGSQKDFDGSMTEDYREIFSLTETVLQDFGEITERYPDL